MSVTPAHKGVWDFAFDNWAEAARADRAYDAAIWTPAYDAGSVPPDVDAEMTRLTDAKYAAEEAVFNVPALNASQLAIKVLIAFDGARDAGHWMDTILNDCRRFASDELTYDERLSVRLGAQPLPAAGHRGWLAERTMAFEMANLADNEREHERHAGRMQPVEDLLMETASSSDDDVIARLVAIAQIMAEGSDPPRRFVTDVLREAADHFGLGSAKAVEIIEGNLSQMWGEGADA